MSQGGRPTAKIVSEILTEVGISFNRIGEFAMLMNPGPDSPYKDKLSDTEIQLVSVAVGKFSNDISEVCQRIKNRTVVQVKSTFRRQAYEKAGLPLGKKQAISTPKTAAAVTKHRRRNAKPAMPKSSAKSADMTLNMLNATEQEVDVEGLSAADKLYYESTDH